MKQLKVSISKGNSKMGDIPSVSLPPCTTCNPEAPCFKKCYAVKIQRLYKTVKTAYENNLEILKNSGKPFTIRIPLIKGVNDDFENLI